MLGIPLNERGVFTGNVLSLLQPYALCTGTLAVSLFAMHGAMYLFLKIPIGPLHERVRSWLWHTWGIFLTLYILTTITTLIAVPRAFANFEEFPWAYAIVLINVLAVANIPRSIFADHPIQAFGSSCLTILSLVSLFGLCLWPNLITASNNAAYSLTVANASSSEKTLIIMAVIAAIGMPLVLTYTTAVYWTFRRRVEIGEHSY
jgi:cytochrome d ubiquinol oxidase subunit II